MRQEKKRRNSCNQSSRSRETLTEPRGRDSPVRHRPSRWRRKCSKPRKIVTFEKQVGYPVTYKGNRDRTNLNKKTDEAIRTVARNARLPFGFEARARLIETNAIPGYHFAIECGMPSEQSQGALTSQIIRTLWPTGTNMRSKEIALAVLVKGHRTDPVQVWAYGTLTTLKVMLSSNETWILLWRQAWKPCRKEESGRGQRDWRPMSTELSRRLGGHWTTRSR